MRKFVSLLLVVGTFAAAVTVLPSSAAPVPSKATWRQVWFPSKDGTMLRADVMLPKARTASQRHPVILSIGPYFGRTGESGPAMRFRDLLTEGKVFERGYAYVQVDSRGYGGSDGCSDFGGPGEQADTEAAVNWAARQSWSNGRVGMWGKSYDAWTQVMALAENPVGLKAAVIQAPLLETYRGMFMNGVHYGGGWYGTPAGYAQIDLTPNTAADRAPEEILYPAKGTATNPACYAENLAMTTLPDRSMPYWQQRDVIADAGRSLVPVLWSHGFHDVNTKPDNFLPVFSKLRGPKRAWIGQWDHVRGNESEAVGRKGFMDEAMAWFDRYLKGIAAPRYPAIEVQDNEGSWRSESSWPPADARRYSMKLRQGAYVDDVVSPHQLQPEPGIWSFSAPAPYDLHLAGAAQLTVAASPQLPGANLIAQLYEVDRYGTAQLITRGAYRLSGPSAVTFSLYPQDWVIDKGSRLGVLIDDNDPLFLPANTGARVDVLMSSLSLPFLRYQRRSDLTGGPAQAMSGVHETHLQRSEVAAKTVSFKFPPRLARR